MKVNMTTTIEVKSNTTAQELSDALASVPATARVSYRHEKYYDQRDHGGLWLNFTWSEER